MPFLTKGKTNWKYILIVLILAVIVGGGILGWKYWLAPPHFDLSTSKYICRDGNPALSERLDKFRETQCLDCVTKIAYICGEKFWIHEYGGLPGRIVNKWSGPYSIKRLQEFKEVAISPSKVEDETANWKTYRNDEYGFEFKYPAEFKFGVKASPEFLVYSPGAAGYLSQEAVKRSIERHWTREKKFNNALFILYYDYCYGGAGSYSRIINAVSHNSSKNYYVNIWIELDGLGGVPQTREFWVDPTWQESYRLTEKGEEWVIQKMMNEEDEEIKIFNQMLSTFRFLE